MKILPFLIFLLASLAALSQVVIKETHANPYFHFSYKNDFFTGTDYYYTQALRFFYAHTGLKKSPVNRLLPGLKSPEHEGYSIFLGQDGFTPTNIRKDFVLLGDRPYSAALFLGQSRFSSSAAVNLRSEIIMGIIGPWALGGEEQRLIHRLTDNAEPKGWKYQIANDFLVNYAMTAERRLFYTNYFEAKVGANANVGTYLTKGGAMVGWKAGKYLPSFSREHPSTSSFRIYAFGNGEIDVIGYNATLQGGLLNRSSVYTIPVSDIRRIVWKVNVGAAISEKNISLSYSHTYIAPEFKGGRPHAWGNIDFRIFL